MPPLGPYQHHEVVSALRKEIKLRNVPRAIHWANVMLHYSEKGGVKAVAKQLWVMAAEDVDDEQVVLRAFAVYQMATAVPEIDHVLFLVARMCRAQFWWETEEGRAVDEAWAQSDGYIARGEVQAIPSYALDRHTRRGYDVLKKQGFWDDRFSGTELGRAKTRYLYLRDGYLHENQELDEGFLAYYSERQQTMALGPERGGIGMVAGEVVKATGAEVRKPEQGQLEL